ncbi:MAG: nucleotide sugar dehydrogenase [Candidatus Alcyoniella australis]|nr:nucleotide sugar dehydrogenase [Candidatus Alcyoniella australis]
MIRPMEKVCVVGLGYIGLPTASIMAANGQRVVGVDVDPAIVDRLSKGSVHIEERGLRTLVSAAISSGMFTVSPEPVQADAFILAVPTPVDDESRADLSHLRDAAESIAQVLKHGDLVVVESTVPPGTTRELVAPILSHRGLEPGRDFLLAHCPERVLPGSILRELVQNDRIIGGFDDASSQRARELYREWVEGEILLTSLEVAEAVKLIENASRDVAVAFANEVAQICAEVGVDPREAIALANRHPRVKILKPGPGVGGHCIPVDPWFLIQAAPRQSRLLKAARQVNDARPLALAKLIGHSLRRRKEPKVVIFGVAYKANVDDTRMSPAIKVIEQLERAHIEYAVYDPHVKNFPHDTGLLEEAVRRADLAVVLAGHDEFRYFDPERIGSLMRTRRLIDSTGVLSVEAWAEAGFEIIEF